ncbi:respiratory chain complex I subunit 1 family protein [Anaeroselena agilis]|uniref:NADH-quinone oxidoreductase subunit H n=1 Tax=Anaeroselena agilis TaxID=3063788 RepID=A0ABU3P2F3_9FIRM|nr:NADH-quinone oxidoreductase subunit H [Selenomonadales bacterium 4137-cl]
MDLLMQFLVGLAQAAMVASLAPLAAGLIKTAKARLQNRRGPGILQPYYDLAKFLGKDSVASPTTSWLFAAAPTVYFAAALGAAALAPVLAPLAFGLGMGFADLFMLLYLFALGRFFLALASLDAGSAFGGMGGSREMFIAVLAEPAILLALLSVALPAKSTGLAAMAASAAGVKWTLSEVFAAGAFFIVLLAETGRIPVDNPDTHLELTMVHEGMILEYSGRPLGLIHWAVAIKQLVMITLFAVLFLPGAPLSWPPLAQAAVLAAKVVATALALAAAETATNKMRLFRIPAFMSVSGVLALLALVAR